VVIEGRIEGLRSRVLGEPQDVATADASEPAGTADEQEAERAHAPDQVRIGAFPRPRFGLGKPVELEAPDEVVREDAELLPGAVGAVVPGRDNIQGELALELGQRLLLGAPATDEGVQGWPVQGHVGGDGGVLEVPVVRGEEIELEVLRTLMVDVLAVDHHAEPEVPRGDVEIVEEAGDVRGDGQPVLPSGGQLLEGQPAPVADLDGVGTASGGQEPEDVASSAAAMVERSKRPPTRDTVKISATRFIFVPSLVSRDSPENGHRAYAAS